MRKNEERSNHCTVYRVSVSDISGRISGTEMSNKNVIEALEKGAETIDRLRRQVELLSIKAEAFDTVRDLVLLLRPRSSMGYEPDAAHIMRELAAKLKADTGQMP